MFLTIIVFLIILSVLVIVHEFGHFIVGKLNGIKIEEFALGLPFTKPLFSKKLKDGMKISLYPLLFGGFVKLLGEESDEKSKNAFGQKNVWQRISVVVAGVTMNLVLAIAVFHLFLALSGFRVLLPKLADYHFRSPAESVVALSEVQPETPAQKAGLAAGDVVVAVDGRTFTKLADFQGYIRSRVGTEITMTVADTTLLAPQRTIKVTPRKDPPANQGPLGVGISEAIIISYSTPEQKIWSGLTYSQDIFVYNLQVLKQLATQSYQTRNVEPLSESVSGPVGIAGAVGMILDLGGAQAIIQLLNLLGLLSLSLAMMNILPFPALDGGRLAFLLVEAVTGRKIPSRVENLINQAGMALLLLFIILVSFNDVTKLVSPWLPKK
jgi:regulator of sigma E protease